MTHRLPGGSLACALALCLAAAPAAAQKSPAAARDTVTLDRVAALVQTGRTTDARNVLLRWWSDVLPHASSRDVQRGLWLRARLTVDPEEATLDYRRLVVEYPGGPYSAQALFRLAQASWASGDSAGAARNIARLTREYPDSHVSEKAVKWLASAGSPPPPPPKPPKHSAPAAETAPATPAPRPAQHGGSSAGERTGRYAVQIGAFSSEARARTVQRKARGAGFEARLVRMPGSRLVHVRVGRYDSESAAGEVMRKLERLGFTAAVVPDANREEHSGG